MTILYLCHRIPYPPNKGDKIRSFHQVRYLGERHRLALACFADDRDDLAHADTLRRWCHSVDVVHRSRRAAKLAGLRGLLDGRSLSVAAYDSRRFRRVVAKQAGEVDIVVAFSSVMAQYAPRDPGVPRLIDFVDLDSAKWGLYAARRPWPSRLLYALEADRLARYEADVAREWDHVLVISEREARDLRPRAPGRPITVIPHGLDVDSFPGASAPGAGAAGDEARIVFTGEMNYFPNVDAVQHFCEDVFPLVRQAVPDARFSIVGRNPTPEVRRLGALPGVNVTGTVPDIRPVLGRMAVSVAPVRVARGSQTKILEAMAAGLPVVASTPASDGLDLEDGSGIVVADEPRVFADRVIELLRDPRRRREAGARGRAYIERHHRWEAHGAALEAILELLVKARSGRRG